MEKILRFNRRDFLKLAGMASLALTSGLTINPIDIPFIPTQKAQAAQSETPSFYFPETGHNLEEPFLTYWRTQGGKLIFGDPITEVIEEGLPFQLFQKARMELHPDNRIMLGLLGSESSTDLPSLEEGSRHLKFARFYDKRGGIEIFGNPISSPFKEEGRLVQVFERAKFIHHPEALDPFYRSKELKYGVTLLALNEVKLENLGEESARQNSIPTDRVEPKPGTIDFASFKPAKRIFVDQREQLLTAYEDDLLVIRAEISSGRRSAPTVVGTFRIINQTQVMPYRGWDEYGNPYFYDEVPFNSLFESSGFFLHAAYWHESFGNTPNKIKGFGTSRGCVNMRLDDAEQLYEWAPVNTLIEIN